MKNVVPILMVRNEEYYIKDVLSPLLKVFGKAIVGDTGSTDKTCSIVRAMNGATLFEYGTMDNHGLGQLRKVMGSTAQSLYGAEWIMQVDGDELYHIEALRQIRDLEVPVGKKAIYTVLVSVDEDGNGRIWELDDLFNRLAIIPPDTGWHGEYPFEVPDVFDDQRLFYHVAPPEGFRYHGIHLHRLRRSPNDQAVIFRAQKQHQFSMQNKTVARTAMFDLSQWKSG